MGEAVRVETPNGPIEVTVEGKLTRDMVAKLVPLLENEIRKHGKVRILFRMHDFHGWTAGALWDDLEFDLKHFADIERLAIVGEKRWEKGMAVFCKPFTTARIRYFDSAEVQEARDWLDEVEVAAGGKTHE